MLKEIRMVSLRCEYTNFMLLTQYSEVYQGWVA